MLSLLLGVGLGQAAPLPLTLTDDRLTDLAGADMACLAGPKAGKGKRKLEITLPEPQTAPVLRLVWTLESGERGPGAGVALRGPGWSDTLSAAVGVELSSTPGAGPDLAPTVLGAGPEGPLEAMIWTIPLGRPLGAVSIEAKGSTRLCVREVSLGEERGLRLSQTDTTGWVVLGDVGVDVEDAALNKVSSPLPRVGLGADGHLQTGEGRPIRFWGVEIRGVPEAAEIRPLVRRLSQLGFNLIRLVEADKGVVSVSAPDAKSTINPDRRAQLHNFASEAANAGLYLWVEGIDRGGLAAEPESGLPDGWRVRPFWSPEAETRVVQQLQAMWGGSLSGGLLLGAPSTLAMTVAPDHSLVNRWGVGLEQLPAPALAELDVRWNEWLKKRYRDDAALASAWAAPVRGGLQPGESLGTVRREPLFPQLADAWPETRAHDLIRFYRELESGFYARIGPVLSAMAPQLLLAPTETRGRGVLQSLHPSSMFSDVRMVWDAPQRGRIEAESLVRRPEAALEVFAGIQAGSAAVVEVRHPSPNPYRAEAPWSWAVLASVQAADVVMWTDWGDDGGGLGSDPAVLLQMPGAARAFREGRIAAATSRWELPIPGEAQEARGWAKDWEPPLMTRDLGVMLSTIVRSKLTGSAAPSDCRRYGATVVLPCAPTEARPYPGPSAVVGGVGWWTDPGILLIDMPDLQVRVGPPGEPVGGGVGARTLGGLRVSLDRWASVALVHQTPLGQRPGTLGPPVARLSISARQENTGMSWALAGGLLRAPGLPPVLAEVPRGTLQFAWPGTPEVRRVAPSGRPGDPVPVRPATPAGWWEIDATLGWLEIRG